ncbi:CHAD domain-containing protein [Stutzerimonas tarimensis]|uniref:CHAD domain-containing protein n=1 Tax=Stutzerimonas tarimensis TaxID=1507735 RepID=A0ABV7T489_9GAMM
MTSFRISAQQPASEEVRRVAQDRLERAIEAIGKGTPKGVHDARKRLKEVRALLRLVRKPLGKRAFAACNGRFRDTARELSTLRDATAIVECWEALAEREPARFASLPFKRIEGRLLARVEAEPAEPRDHQALIEGLRGAADAVGDWPLRSEGFSLFRAGLLRTYQDGRRAMKAAQQNPSDELLHDWRKRVKDHWYQTRLLREAWPRLFKARQKSLETLADCLGDDHDLAMLQLLMKEQAELFGAQVTFDELAAVVAQRRAELQSRAWREGHLLYAEKPDALVSLWGNYWRVARKER